MRTEVRRGRKFVEYIDDSLPVGTFVQEIGAHNVSYQDEQGVWLPADENWSTDGLDGYLVKADKLNHKVRLKSDGGRRWYPRRNVESEYLTFGIPQFWSRNKWGNFGFSGWSVDGKTITLETKQNVTIKIHSLWNGIKIDWVLNNANAPVRMRYPVALTGITESEGVLYGADNTELGRLTPTTAIDANEVELLCSGGYANGYVEFSADVTGAVFPVVIDPDFAGESSFGYVQGYYQGDYSIARSTATSVLTTALSIQNRTAAQAKSYIQRSFIQFDTSDIGATSTVTQVNLRMVLENIALAGTVDVQIAKYNWSSCDPLASGNMETAYDGCLAASRDDSIWCNLSGKSTNTQYTSGNLSTEWVSKTGITYYGLQSSADYAGTGASGEWIGIAAPTNATESYRPCLIVAYSAGGQNLTLTCEAGSYSLTGTNVTLTHTPASQNLTLACNAGSYSLTGTNADLTVKRNYVLACEGGSYSLTGTNADITSSRTLICEPASGGAYPDIIVSGAGSSDANGTYNYVVMWSGKPSYTSGDNSIWWYDNKWAIINAFESGNRYESTEDVATPDLVTTWTVGADGTLPVPTVTIATTYVLTGSDVTLTYTQGAQSYTLTCEAGSYSLTGTNADLTVTRHYTLTCEAGSYSLTGTNADFEVKRNYVLTCEAGSYSLTGTNADLTVKRNYVLACGAGNYLITGTDATLTVQRNYTLVCEPGSYSLTGTDITFGNSKAYSLTCEAGAYTLTGSSVSFVVQRNYSLACEAGSYSLTGTDVTLTYTQGAQNFTLACETGSYALTGTNAGLTSARTMALEAGSYTLTGTNADFYRALVMACEAGSYALTGTDASLTSHRIFALGMGSYVLVGTACGLFILSPTPACRTATIEYENRTFAIPHENRTATIEFENRTLEVKCH